MYKCIECGHIFEEGEQSVWKEDRGEYWGVPCSETMYGCPICKGDYERSVRCEICHSEHLAEELKGGVCEECIEDYSHDADMCKRIGAHSPDKIEINLFLATMFTKDEIEEILFEIVKRDASHLKTDFKRFVETDEYWFGERLAEEVRKDENTKG